MARKRPLPDPRWDSNACLSCGAERSRTSNLLERCECCGADRVCVACGYALTGLAVPGRCPECGTGYSERELVLHGVPRRAGGPLWRRVVWVLLGVGAFGISQGFGVAFMIPGGLVIMGVTLATIIAGATAMLLTGGARERSGAARFVFTEDGLTVKALSGESSDALRYTWDEIRGARIQRISDVWFRLRLTRGEDGFGGVVFDAGVRCPSPMAQDVLDTIRGFTGSSAGAATPSA